MSKRSCKLWALVLCLLLLFSALPTAACAASDSGAGPVSEGLNAAVPSPAEIQSFADALPYTTSDKYAVSPSLAEPYRAGVLSDETLQTGLSLLNLIRYVAGLPADVSLSADYSGGCSAATLLNALNDVLSYSPSRPSALSAAKYDQLVKDGQEGASHSNLGHGYQSLSQALLFGWMADDDANNIDRAGHRRWVLSPGMRQVGFGKTESYYAMYAVDGYSGGADVSVAWPAQNMPVELFNAAYPWTLSPGLDEASSLDEADTSVTLTRRSDGRVWEFSSAKSNGDFYVNNTGYGSPGCIIFRPSSLDGVSPGDVFDVSIAYTVQRGSARTSHRVEYSVSFFHLDSPIVNALAAPASGGDWVRSGENWYYVVNGTAVGGWRTLDGTTYYFDPASGAMASDEWVESGGKWYYFSGALTTGWAEIDGAWYYFDADGVMLTGKQSIDGSLYLFADNGVLQSGKWLQDGEDWYYLAGSGAAYVNQWLKSGDTWYYFGADGIMLAGTSQSIDGKVYTFDASGACTNP